MKSSTGSRIQNLALLASCALLTPIMRPLVPAATAQTAPAPAAPEPAKPDAAKTPPDFLTAAEPKNTAQIAVPVPVVPPPANTTKPAPAHPAPAHPATAATAPAPTHPASAAPARPAVVAPRPVAPLPVAPVPSAPNINILILALDDVDGRSTTGSGPPAATSLPGPALPAPTPRPAPVAPGAITPALPSDIVPALPEAVKPAAPAPATPALPTAPGLITPAVTSNRVTVRFNAKQKPPPENPFTLEPDRPTAYAPGQRPGTSAAAAPASGAGHPATVVAPGSIAPGPDVQPAGRAQTAASPLRRALLRSGYHDVLSLAPDSASVMRAINAGRITPRVLDTLRSSMAQTVALSLDTVASAGGTGGAGASADAAAAPATDPRVAVAMAPAVLSAARVGQALGYRAVVVLAVVPRSGTPGDAGGANAEYSMLMVDAANEVGQPVRFDVGGAGDAATDEAGGAATMLDQRLREWPQVGPDNTAQRVAMHFAAARTAVVRGDTPTAQDELNQVISLDPSRVDAYILLGDVLQKSDPSTAAAAYRQAAEIKRNDGAVWAKLAVSYTMGSDPSWPSALDAAGKAIAAGYDSATLQTTMATAQFGRASQFRKYHVSDKAEDAEMEARQHLDKALRMEPDNPQVARLMAGQLLADERYADAVQALDRLALLYPDDVQLQTQYAQALSGYGRRYEDAFAAWARVWKLTNEQTVTLETGEYRRLAEGFDRRIDSIGRSAYELSSGVMNGALQRETALLQVTKLQEDMDAADAAINKIRPPVNRRDAANHTSRVFAAALMNQCLDNYRKYMETGQDMYRTRAFELYRQSINRLNSFRAPQTPDYGQQGFGQPQDYGQAQDAPADQ